jgi:hypothetical protein
MKKLIPIIVFLLISSVYFFPALKGYGLFQPDIKKHLGMSKEIEDYREKYGKEPLWTGSMFSGMPAYQISLESDNLLVKVEFLVIKIIPPVVFFVFLLMAGMYFLLLCFKVKWAIAMIGGIAFGLAAFNILYLSVGHNSKIHSLAFVPFILGCVVYAYRTNSVKGAIFLSLFLSLHIAAGHLQITYYLLFAILAFIVVEFIRNLKAIKRFLITSVFILFAGGLAVMSNATTLFTTFDYSTETIRGKSELMLNKETLHKLIRYQRTYIRDKEKLNQIIEHQIDSLRNEKNMLVVWHRCANTCEEPTRKMDMAR